MEKYNRSFMQEFYKEVKQKIPLKRAKTHRDNQANNIAIEKLEQEGVEMEAFLMKNLCIAFKVTSQVEKYTEQWGLKEPHIWAAKRFKFDYERNNISNYSKSVYSDMPITSLSFKPKDPSMDKVQSSRNIAKIKDAFKGNAIYYLLLEKFCGDEFSVRALKTKYKLGHATIKDRLIEALEILLLEYREIYRAKGNKNKTFSYS